MPDREGVQAVKGGPSDAATLRDELVHDLYAAGPWGEFIGFLDNGVRALTDAHSPEVYGAMVDEIEARIRADQTQRIVEALDRAYHPQNPSDEHPVDLIRREFGAT